MSKPRECARLIGVVALVASLAGCAGDTAAGRDSAVRANPTPELQTLGDRYIDTDNRVALTVDENLRMANQDLLRLWLLDRPSRLTRERVPR
ncbi:MAG: hypothetical protein ACKVW3_05970 [Phycisphaerales bacterium]